MDVYFFKSSSLSYSTKTKQFSECNEDEFMRYIKTRFTNIERLKSNFINLITPKLDSIPDDRSEDRENLETLLNKVVDVYPTLKPFTYVEAFKLESDDFKALIFGEIRIPEMIAELGHKRIKTEGMPVNHKQFDGDGNFTGMKEYDVIYETHEVNGDKLGLDENVYAVRCWCTTTNEEHWLWIDDKFKDDPLEAIANTFVIHENLVPYIKELKRQGDVLLVELTEEIEPEGDKVSLSKEQYFGLLTAQS